MWRMEGMPLMLMGESLAAALVEESDAAMLWTSVDFSVTCSSFKCSF